MLPAVGVRLVAEDEAKFSSDLAKAGKGLDLFEKGASDSAGALKGTTQQTKAAGLSLTDLASGLSLAKQGFAAVEGAVKSVVDPFIAYANQVEDLARNSGLTARESSVLLNVSDDLRISFDTLKMAAKELNKDGIQPNMANMTKLAAQYQAIKDPVQRAQFATDHFGRSAQEMTKFLETDIKTLAAMSKEVEHSGLVIDESGIQKAKDYQAAMDDWNDSILSVKLAIAQGLLPAISDGIATGAQWVQTVHAASDALMAHRISLIEYYKLSAQVVWTDKTMADALDELANKTEVATYTESQHGEALQGTTKAIADDEYAIWHAVQATKALGDTRREAIKDARDHSAALLLEAEAHKSAGQAAALQTSMLDELTTATLYQIAAEGLDSEGKLELARSLGLVDEATYAATQKILGQQQALADGKITQEDYIRGIDAINAGNQEIPGALTPGLDALGRLHESLDSLPERKQIEIDTYFNDIHTLINRSSNDEASALGGNHAAGADFIVPPGFPNDTFRMNVESGERVIVVPQDQVSALHPAPLSAMAGSTYDDHSQGPTYIYSPTYSGSAPPPEQGFATMTALFA